MQNLGTTSRSQHHRESSRQCQNTSRKQAVKTGVDSNMDFTPAPPNPRADGVARWGSSVRNDLGESYSTDQPSQGKHSSPLTLLRQWTAFTLPQRRHPASFPLPLHQRHVRSETRIAKHLTEFKRYTIINTLVSTYQQN